MIGGAILEVLEKVVRWVVIVWGGTLLGATMFLLTR